MFTFVAGSKGSLDAVAELSRAFGKEVRKRPDTLPLVSLKVDAYQHRDRTIGRVKVPAFDIVDYVEEALRASALDDARNSKSAAPAKVPERAERTKTEMSTFSKRPEPLPVEELEGYAGHDTDDNPVLSTPWPRAVGPRDRRGAVNPLIRQDAMLTLEALADRPIWVGWRPETKVPYDPKTRTHAKCDNSTTWAPRNDAEL